MSPAIALGRSAANAIKRHPVLAVILVYGAAAAVLMIVRARVNPSAFRIEGPAWAGIGAVVDIVGVAACLTCLLRRNGKRADGRVEVSVGAAVLVVATASMGIFAFVEPVMAGTPAVPHKPEVVAGPRQSHLASANLDLVLDPIRTTGVGSTAITAGSVRGGMIPPNAEVHLFSRSHTDAVWRRLGIVRPDTNRRFRASVVLRKPNETAPQPVEIVACLGESACDPFPRPDGICSWPSQLVSVLHPHIRITQLRVRPSRQRGLRTVELEGYGRHLDDGDTIWLQTLGSTDHLYDVQPVLRNGDSWFARAAVERGLAHVYVGLSDGHPGLVPIFGATRATVVVR